MDDITHYTRQHCRTSVALSLLLILKILPFSRMFEHHTPICYQHTNTVHWTRQ